ncbi:hypothetical protein LTS10_002864 [Elasticomyces elasticus]|nr:hypothetical protein LTS10_002864 [Elasticomyces elasticus]
MARTKQTARKSARHAPAKYHYESDPDSSIEDQEIPASRQRSLAHGSYSDEDDSDIDVGLAKRLRPLLPKSLDELQRETLSYQLAEAGDDNQMLLETKDGRRR